MSSYASIERDKGPGAAALALAEDFKDVVAQLRRITLPVEALQLLADEVPFSYVHSVYRPTAVEAQQRLLAVVARQRDRNATLALLSWMELRSKDYMLSSQRADKISRQWGIAPVPFGYVVGAISGGRIIPVDPSGSSYTNLVSMLNLFAGLAVVDAYRINLTDMGMVVRMFKFFKKLEEYVATEGLRKTATPTVEVGTKS